MSESAHNYYINFTRGVAPADVIEWEQQITDAESKRMQDRSQMDIIGATKPPREEAIPAAGSETNRGPIVDWIQLGIVLEEKQ